MATVLSVETRLTGDASQMVAATKQAQLAMRNLEASVKNIRDTFEGTGNKIGNAVANGAMKAVGALQNIVAQAASAALTVATIATAMGTGFFFAAARVQELDVAMQAVAKSSGIAYADIRATADAIRSQGIEMATAQEMATQFARVNLDMASAAKVARVAQDLAVISGQNSTQVTGQLMQAILTQNTELLRSAGLTRTAADAYNDFSAATGVSVDSMTEMQKKQAIINLIMSEGARVAGTYEASMTSASKVIRSFPRLFNDISISLGESLVEAFGPAIVASYDLVKAFSKAVGVGGNLRPVIDAIGDAIVRFSGPLSGAIEGVTKWVKGLDASPTVVKKVSDALNSLGQMGPGIAAVGAAIASLGMKGIPILGDILPAVNPLLAAFLALTLASPQLREAMGPLFDAIKGALPQVRDLVETTGRALMTKFIPAFEDLIRSLTPVIPALLSLATVLARNVVSVLPGAITLFTNLVNAVVPLLTWIAKLPAPIQGVGAALIGLQAAGVPIGGMLAQVGEAVLRVGGYLLGANTGIMSFSDSLAQITVKGGGVSGVLSGIATFLTGPWGLAIGAAVAAIGIFAMTAMPQAVANADELTASLDRQTGAFTEATRASVFKALQDGGGYELAKKYGIGLDILTDAAMGNTAAQAAVAVAVQQAKDAMVTGADGTMLGRAATIKFNAEIARLNDLLYGQSGAIADARTEWANWGVVTGAAKTQYDEFRGSLDAANAAIAANGATMDTSTAAGIANKQALDTLATSMQEAMLAAENQGYSTAALTALQGEAYNSFIKTAEGMGISREEAILLIAKMEEIPPQKVIEVIANTDGAMGRLDAIKSRLAELRNAGFTIGGQGMAIPQANGGMWDSGGLHYANGAMHQARQSMMAMGGQNITWAEPETGWEAYISGKKSMAQRSASIWADAGKRLGLLSDQAPGAQGGNLTLENHFHGSYMDPDSVAQATFQTMRFATT